MVVIVDGNPEGPRALSITFAVFEEIGDVFFFSGPPELYLIDVHPEVILVAPVGSVENAVLTEAHCLDVIETGATSGVAPDSVAPIVDSPFLNRCERHSAPPLDPPICLHPASFLLPAVRAAGRRMKDRLLPCV